MSHITITNQLQAQSQPLALTPATGTNKPARFTSWRELCKGGRHTYPAADNIYNSDNYRKQPPRFQVSPNGMRFQDCRICQELEKNGRNKDVYEGHYGNYPTHCPKWSEMPMDEKEKITKIAGYCHQCMNHKFVFKSFSQLNKHVATK